MRPPQQPVSVVPPINTPALLLLHAQHPELALILQQQATEESCTLQVSQLPAHSRRFVWQLYRKHNPEFAQWLTDVAETRETFGATLALRALDILRFLNAEGAPSDQNR
jgi:hypothetical protein